MAKRLIRTLGALALGACAPPLAAQAVIQADRAVIQPQIYRDGPTINGCGQRIVLMSVVSEKEAYIADFSISVRADMAKQNIWAMSKGGISKQDPGKDIETRTTVPIKSFFFSSPDGAVAIAPAKFIPAETAGFLLGIGRDDTGPAAELMLKMRAGQRTQFGIHLKSESVARVYSYTPEIDPADAQDFDACMKGFMSLIGRLQKELERDSR